MIMIMIRLKIVLFLIILSNAFIKNTSAKYDSEDHVNVLVNQEINTSQLNQLNKSINLESPTAETKLEITEPNLDQDLSLTKTNKENFHIELGPTQAKEIKSSTIQVKSPNDSAQTKKANEPKVVVHQHEPIEKENINVIKNPILSMYPSKYCADIKPIKDLFNEHIEPIYHPLISMLPKEFQIILLDETPIAGLNTASCIFISILPIFLLLVWFLLSKKSENSKSSANKVLNEQILSLNSKIKSLQFEKETFEHEVNDLTAKLSTVELDLNDKDSKLRDLLEKHYTIKNSTSTNLKELEKLRANEIKLKKELTEAKLELHDLNEKHQLQMNEFDMQANNSLEKLNDEINDLKEKLMLKENELSDCVSLLNEKENSISLYKSNEAALNSLIEQHEQKIILLQNSLLRGKKIDLTNNESADLIQSDDAQLDNLMNCASLQMEIKKLEDALIESKSIYELKSNECSELMLKLSEKDNEIEKTQLRYQDFEKQLRENEMQIKLLNELREKDTKQHIKSLAELDIQLKKKSSDADKVSHLLDQIRAKQERIQELESQFARVEKQSSQERQTYEKQAHENWLNAKKIDKELKDSRNETSVLKERLAELESINKSLTERQAGLGGGAFVPNTRYYVSPMHQQQQTSENNKAKTDSALEKVQSFESLTNALNENSSLIENKTDQPLQVDTTSSEPKLPASNDMPNIIQPQYPFMKPPFPRYPFPNPAAMMAFMPQEAQAASQSPDLTSTMPRMPYSVSFQSPHQQMLYRMNSMMYQQPYLHRSNSGASSQQPSPGGLNLSLNAGQSLPFSNSFINSSLTNLNDSTSNLNSPRDTNNASRNFLSSTANVNSKMPDDSTNSNEDTSLVNNIYNSERNNFEV